MFLCESNRRSLSLLRNSRIKILLRLLYFQELTRIGRDDLVLTVRCDNLDSRMFRSGKNIPSPTDDSSKETSHGP